MNSKLMKAIYTVILGGGATVLVAMLFDSPEMGIACALIVIATILAVK